MARFSIPALADKLQTEADAYLFLEELRWGKGGPPVCPHCDHEGANFIRPANGSSRRTRTGTESQRRVWQCKACRRQFSVLTGTVMHGSKIPVRTWLFVIFDMMASKNGIAAREVERRYALTPKSAWFMLHRIREAMKREPLAHMLRGTIVADEAWIGGQPKYRHASKQAKQPERLAPGTRQNQATDKQPIVALVHVETGEVRTAVVADVTGHSLRKVIAEQVDMANSDLHTDESSAYNQVRAEFRSHGAVNHSAGEYVRGRGHNQPGGGVLLAAQAVPRRHPPPRQPTAFAQLPGRIRLPILNM